MFKFYHAQYNPSTLSGTVGGQISSNLLSGYIGELFAHVEAPPYETSVSSYQYRKVFIKNEFDSTSTHTRVWIDSLEHEGQISLALDPTTGSSAPSPLSEPSVVSGWQSPENFSNGLDLGTLPKNTYKSIWIKQSLSGIYTPDPYATFRIYVGGIVE